VATLADGELHVWIADLDASGSATGRSRRQDLLSQDERERAARFWHRRDGERWARSHALLRSLLGSYLGTDPAGLCFEYGQWGKPRLAGEHTRLRFNMSHSGRLALYAFALDFELGIDVETAGGARYVPAVAERAFGADVRRRLEQLDESNREHEFLRLWVRHEARLKCWETGLGGARSAGDRECWTIDVDADLGEWAAAAAAAPCAPAKVECWRLRAVL
jgi:4'-phosphopantetheinyl transferase